MPRPNTMPPPEVAPVPVAKKPRRPGRPSKLTTPIRDRIAWYLQRGHYKQVAASLAGVHRDTLNGWEQRGRAARSVVEEGLDLPAEELPYLELLELVEFSCDYGEGWLHEQWLDASENPRDMRWQGYATMLERRHRERWRRPSAIEFVGQSGTSDGPVEVRLSFAPNPALADDLRVR